MTLPTWPYLIPAAIVLMYWAGGLGLGAICMTAAGIEIVQNWWRRA